MKIPKHMQARFNQINSNELWNFHMLLLMMIMYQRKSLTMKYSEIKNFLIIISDNIHLQLVLISPLFIKELCYKIYSNLTDYIY